LADEQVYHGADGKANQVADKAHTRPDGRSRHESAKQLEGEPSAHVFAICIFEKIGCAYTTDGRRCTHDAHRTLAIEQGVYEVGAQPGEHVNQEQVRSTNLVFERSAKLVERCHVKNQVGQVGVAKHAGDDAFPVLRRRLVKVSRNQHAIFQGDGREGWCKLRLQPKLFSVQRVQSVHEHVDADERVDHPRLAGALVVFTDTHSVTSRTWKGDLTKNEKIYKGLSQVRVQKIRMVTPKRRRVLSNDQKAYF